MFRQECLLEMAALAWSVCELQLGSNLHSNALEPRIAQSNFLASPTDGNILHLNRLACLDCILLLQHVQLQKQNESAQSMSSSSHIPITSAACLVRQNDSI